MSDAAIETALRGAVAEEGHYIRIAERGPVGQVTLRVDLSHPSVVSAVNEAAGAVMPYVRGATVGEDGKGAVWMAPDELLILTDDGAAGETATRLSAALSGVHHMALDVSDARAVLRLEGAKVAEVLMKGMPVDLRDAAFPPGSSRRSHLGGLAVGLWRIAPEIWEIVCFRSYAHHLFDWLRATSVEGSQVDMA